MADNKQNQKPEEKKEVKTEQDVQEEAKRIADMEAKIIALQTENKALKEAAEKVVSECNKKLAMMDHDYQDAYKGQMMLKEKQAQDQVKAKMAELEKKANELIAEKQKYAIKDQALELIDIIAEFEKALSHTPSDPKIAN